MVYQKKFIKIHGFIELLFIKIRWKLRWKLDQKKYSNLIYCPCSYSSPTMHSSSICCCIGLLLCFSTRLVVSLVVSQGFRRVSLNHSRLNYL